VNVALGSQGATATASSIKTGYEPEAAIDGDRRGKQPGKLDYWQDDTAGVVPDWIEIVFNGARTLDEISIFSVQDSYNAPIEPTPAMVATLHGLVDFTVQYWSAAGWQVVPGGIVRGNTQVWRTIAFAPLSTSRIRVLVERAQDAWSRVAEIEAYETTSAVGDGGSTAAPPTVALTSPSNNTSVLAPGYFTLTASAADPDGDVAQVTFFANGQPVGQDTTAPYSIAWTSVPAGVYSLTAVASDSAGASATSAPVLVYVTAEGSSVRANVALASQGATATASSAYSEGYLPRSAINGDRRGLRETGYWNDATSGAGPDWLEVAFSGPKTLQEIDIFAVQDDYGAPSEPTPGMATTLYGLADFTVQYWTEAGWADISGGVVRGNTLVWWSVTFAPLTTSRIRVVVERPQDLTFSRVAEIEAYEAVSVWGGNAPPTVGLISPVSGTALVAPASIALAAWASDSDGTVARVDFYAGTTLVGSALSSPYAFTWANVPAGTYALTAVARDNLGAMTVSGTHDITVTSSQVLSKAIFTPASIHDSVERYVLEIFVAGSDPNVAPPVATQDLGKPAVVNNECTADVRNLLLSLWPGSYIATVSAVSNQAGTLRSDPTPAFTR
jgi:hypothetical protein